MKLSELKKLERTKKLVKDRVYTDENNIRYMVNSDGLL